MAKITGGSIANSCRSGRATNFRSLLRAGPPALHLDRRHQVEYEISFGRKRHRFEAERAVQPDAVVIEKPFRVNISRMNLPSPRPSDKTKSIRLAGVGAPQTDTPVRPIEQQGDRLGLAQHLQRRPPDPQLPVRVQRRRRQQRPTPAGSDNVFFPVSKHILWAVGRLIRDFA
jgi:hypothetical protein